MKKILFVGLLGGFMLFSSLGVFAEDDDDIIFLVPEYNPLTQEDFSNKQVVDENMKKIHFSLPDGTKVTME